MKFCLVLSFFFLTDLIDRFIIVAIQAILFISFNIVCYIVNDIFSAQFQSSLLGDPQKQTPRAPGSLIPYNNGFCEHLIIIGKDLTGVKQI